MEFIPMTEYDLQEERRKIYQAVPYERRSTVSTDLHTRVAILEVQQNNHADSIFGMKESNAALVNKLDTHIINSTTRDHELQMSVSKITIAVTNLSDNVIKTNQSLTTIAEMATESRNQIVKWDAIASALFKACGVAAIIIGAAWSLFTFLESKTHEQVPLLEIPAHIANEISPPAKQ
jgi:hypothetical protein